MGKQKKSEFVFLFFISLKVGASYSAEDIALQTIKYGASKVICTYRTRPLGFKWPETIEERPIFTHVEKDGKVIHFSDGTTAEVDVILFCTGNVTNSDSQCFHLLFCASSIQVGLVFEWVLYSS